MPTLIATRGDLGYYQREDGSTFIAPLEKFFEGLSPEQRNEFAMKVVTAGEQPSMEREQNLVRWYDQNDLLARSPNPDIARSAVPVDPETERQVAAARAALGQQPTTTTEYPQPPQADVIRMKDQSAVLTNPEDVIPGWKDESRFQVEVGPSKVERVLTEKEREKQAEDLANQLDMELQ